MSRTIVFLAFVAVMAVVPVRTAFVSDAGASPAASPTCAPLVWKNPYQWWGGSLLEKTYNASECARLVIRNDLHSCKPHTPWIQCNSDEECTKGQLCGEAMAPRLCVTCDMEHITNTWYEYSNITLNVTESMLRGQFWTENDFYNHTGVDLVLTLERWVWSPNMKALLHDFVQQHRSTWTEGLYNSDMFNTFTEAYQRYNATHISLRWASSRRDAYDILDGGKIEVHGYSGTSYLPVA